MAEERVVDLSIVIVNYCQWQLTINCLRTLPQASEGITYETFVIDNGSDEDRSEEVRREFPDVKLHMMGKNLGFGPANNVGLRLARGRHALLLNNDTECYPKSLTNAVAFMDKHPECGIGGCKLVDEHGEALPSGRSFPSFSAALFSSKSLFTKIFPKNPFSAKYILSDWDRTDDREVDWVTGAGLIIRKEVMDQVGLLDEEFFMYCEDTDWCFRVKKAGWKVYFIADSVIYHIWGVGGKATAPRRILYHHQSMYLFYRKHWANNPLKNVVVAISIAGRCAFLMFTAKCREICQSMIRGKQK